MVDTWELVHLTREYIIVMERNSVPVDVTRYTAAKWDLEERRRKRVASREEEQQQPRGTPPSQPGSCCMPLPSHEAWDGLPHHTQDEDTESPQPGPAAPGLPLGAECQGPAHLWL